MRPTLTQLNQTFGSDTNRVFGTESFNSENNPFRTMSFDKNAFSHSINIHRMTFDDDLYP